MASTSVTSPKKGRWESTAFLIIRIVSACLAAGGAAIAALWTAMSWPDSWLRIALGIAVLVFAVLAALFQGGEAVAKSRREKHDLTSTERLRRDYSLEFGALLSSLSDALHHAGGRLALESFIGQSAEKFLSLVGNEDRCLRVAIYRLDGREDDVAPDDDYKLERIGSVPHGRDDMPRFEFKHSDPVERDVIKSLDRREIIKWNDLTKDAPRGYDKDKSYKAFYTMPLVAPDNAIKGMMTCDTTEAGSLGARHEQTLKMIARAVTIGLILMPTSVHMTLEDDGTEGDQDDHTDQ